MFLIGAGTSQNFLDLSHDALRALQRRQHSGRASRMRRGFRRLCAVFVAWTGPGLAGAHAQDAVPLLIEQGLKGWRVERVRANVRSDVLHVEGGPGWVRTDGVYSDFVLKLEFRLVGDGAAGGIFVRAWPTFDDRTSAPSNGYRLTFREPAQSPTPGVWHRLEIECIGNVARVRFDDSPAYRMENIANPQGHFALWAAGGRAEFRNVEIRELPVAPAGQIADGVAIPGKGVINPRVTREVKPRYTADAMAARIQGAVLMSAVVLSNGTVGEVKILRSLDPRYGLDQEAVTAARQWRFAPGTREGEPVAVLVTLELTFTLK